MSSVSGDASRAVTHAEAVVDNVQLQVDIASSRGREEMIVALARIRATVGVMQRMLNAYQDEHVALLNEIDRLEHELAAQAIAQIDELVGQPVVVDES